MMTYKELVFDLLLRLRLGDVELASPIEALALAYVVVLDLQDIIPDTPRLAVRAAAVGSMPQTPDHDLICSIHILIPFPTYLNRSYSFRSPCSLNRAMQPVSLKVWIVGSTSSYQHWRCPRPHATVERLDQRMATLRCRSFKQFADHDRSAIVPHGRCNRTFLVMITSRRRMQGLDENAENGIKRSVVK